MKLLFLLFVTVIIAIAVYALTSKWFGNTKKNKKNHWKPLGISTMVVFILLGLIAFGVYSTNHQPDIQCSSSHTAISNPPSSLKTATDYLAQGDYDYDTGNCPQAVANYTKAITLNPNYAKAYNNRAYTNMRLRNYKDALPDLDKAIQLNPNYIQALMNRGDIHNYYYQIDRQAAIADYKKVISLSPSGGNSSVCGHLFLAKHNGWNLGTYLDFFRGAVSSCS